MELEHERADANRLSGDRSPVGGTNVPLAAKDLEMLVVEKAK